MGEDESIPSLPVCEIRTHLGMKLVFVGILRVSKDLEGPIFLARRFNSSHIPFFKRSAISDFATFSARYVASRVGESEKMVLQENGAKLYSLKWDNGLCIVCLTGQDYPDRVAFTLIHLLYSEFIKLYPSTWHMQMVDVKLKFPNLKEIMEKYNKPEDIDAIAMTEYKVSQTLKIVRSTVADILRNGENLESLVDRSKDLSIQTKKIFKRSKALKRNACCALM